MANIRALYANPGQFLPNTERASRGSAHLATRRNERCAFSTRRRAFQRVTRGCERGLAPVRGHTPSVLGAWARTKMSQSRSCIFCSIHPQHGTARFPSKARRFDVEREETVSAVQWHASVLRRRCFAPSASPRSPPTLRRCLHRLYSQNPFSPSPLCFFFCCFVLCSAGEAASQSPWGRVGWLSRRGRRSAMSRTPWRSRRRAARSSGYVGEPRIPGALIRRLQEGGEPH